MCGVKTMSWPTFWTKKRSWQSFLLKPLSSLVCFIADRRYTKFIKSKPVFVADTKIIVVGNIVVGGSGKTPFILWLGKVLKKEGITFGIVSRGYGGKNKQGAVLVTENSNPNEVGDEPVLLAKKLQCLVAVSTKRQQAVQLLNQYCKEGEKLDVIIADDGLQHYEMPRDIEVIIFDGKRGLGNNQCLPAGPLRESVKRLVSAKYIVSNGPCEDSRIDDISIVKLTTMTLKPSCYRQVKAPENSLPLNAFEGKSCYAIAGIGNPSRFFSSLDLLGVKAEAKPFADHKAYQEKDFNWKQDDKPLLMTEKDAVKCTQFAQDDWWYLEIVPSCSNELASKLVAELKRARKLF